MNIVFISADDMSYNSTGMSGCEIPDITPNLDKLGQEGVFFENAHTTVGLCQPSRSVWMTGLYPWNNGAVGFNCINEHITTLPDILKNRGYTTGIIGKAEHLCPDHKFKWSQKILGYDKITGQGKNINAYYNFCKSFFSSVPDPFFLMVNSHYPHRPFEKKTRYDPSSVKVPGFLPDIPEVRTELAQYYEGVKRCDLTVGEIIRALKESGKIDNTLIIFTSDHGMSFPFVKANCYHFSSRIPLIWHCPEVLKPKISDTYVSSVDIMPTILELLGLQKTDMDGTSYLNTIKKGSSFKNNAYTCLCQLWVNRNFQTRAIHNEDYCYIVNFWSNGKNEFIECGCNSESLSMCGITRTDMKMHNKIRFREPEELYNIKNDPFAKTNIASKDKKGKLKMMHLMKNYAEKSNDQITKSYLKSIYYKIHI